MSVEMQAEESFRFQESALIRVRVNVLNTPDFLDRKFVERRVVTRALITTGFIGSSIRNPVEAANELSDKAEIVSRESIRKGPLGITREAEYLVRVMLDEGED